jgi:hypothetical protein
MIEILHSLWPPYQFRISTEMFDMTAGAILEALTGMQSPVFSDTFCKQGMALEALARANSLAGLMAFLAVSQAFEERVGFVQIAGRKLCKRNPRQNENKRPYYCQDPYAARDRTLACPFDQLQVPI